MSNPKHAGELTDQQAIDILCNALSAVLNCEGAARTGAGYLAGLARENGRPDYIGQDCTEFDRARDAFAFLNAHGFDVDAAWQRGDMIDY